MHLSEYAFVSDKTILSDSVSECVIISLLWVFQHVVLSLKFMLAYAIPDLPDWVAEEKARLEYMRRNALKVDFNPIQYTQHMVFKFLLNFHSA